MEEKEIKVGDRVAIEDSQYSGVVTEICNGRCKVRYPSGRVINFPVEVLEHRDDPQTAFLRDLSELLRKHEANICWAIGMNFTECAAIMKVHTPYFNLQYSGADGVTLTPDNVLNYDK